MRKLASIRRIESIRPIEGADMIEAVQVGLWICVAKKGEFQAGDLAVYFEIDSFLPGADERFKFLEKDFRTFEGKVGARLKTKKMRGQISQGLALPLSSFPELSDFKEEDDVGEVLGVVKWEPQIPATLYGQAKGNFPAFIKKTDQERLQNIWRNYERWMEEDEYWEITKKIDGSSMTVYTRDEDSGVCSRNIDLKESEDNSFWNTCRTYNILSSLKELKRNLALQGEMYGPGIQGNSEKVSTLKFALFDIWDIDRSCYLGVNDRDGILFQLRNLGYSALSVPRKMVTKLSKFPTFESIQKAMDEDPDTYEGWVFKRVDGQESFKVISNKYLLKHGDR